MRSDVMFYLCCRPAEASSAELLRLFPKENEKENESKEVKLQGKNGHDTEMSDVEQVWCPV